MSLKWIRPFKVLKYIREVAYKLDLLTIYERLYLIFHISLLEEFIPKKGQEPDQYAPAVMPELADEDNSEE